MGKNHTTKTAKTIYDVMRWVETTAHHSASAEDPKFLILKGHTNTLRIPTAISQKCAGYLKPGEPLDMRMYRWDFRITDAAREERLHWLEEFMLPIDDTLDRVNFLRHFKERLLRRENGNYPPPNAEQVKTFTKMALDPDRQVPVRSKKASVPEIKKGGTPPHIPSYRQGPNGDPVKGMSESDVFIFNENGERSREAVEAVGEYIRENIPKAVQMDFEVGSGHAPETSVSLFVKFKGEATSFTPKYLTKTLHNLFEKMKG